MLPSVGYPRRRVTRCILSKQKVFSIRPQQGKKKITHFVKKKVGQNILERSVHEI
jgi:hypothetical protein